MRQGIVVTCLLGLFVAAAMPFTGGASLFTVPEAPAGAVATAIAEAVPPPPAEPPVRGPEPGAARSAGADGTFALLHWLAVGFGQVDFGKDHGAGQGLSVTARRGIAAIEQYVPFHGRPPSTAAQSDATQTSLVGRYATSGSVREKVSFRQIGSPPEAPAPASEPAYDRAAEDTADFARFSFAADGGDINAEYRLGLLYRDGRGADRDPAAAVHWLLASAKGGNPLAAIAIAEMYDAGFSVTRDAAAAYMWLDLAAADCRDASDRDFALKERDRVAAALTREQLDQARRASRQLSVTRNQKIVTTAAGSSTGS